MSTLIDKARIARKAALGGLTAPKSVPTRLRLSTQPEKLAFVSTRTARACAGPCDDMPVPHVIPLRADIRKRPARWNLLEAADAVAGMWASYGTRLQ